MMKGNEMRYYIRTSTAVAALMAASGVSPAFAQADNSSTPERNADTSASDIIVTGTRAGGMTQSDSPAPIKLLSEEAIQHVGQPSLGQVLTQLVPSFNVNAFGGDTGALTLSARLRGLSPNHTLVLINGKRRHGTANLAVLSGPTQGGAAPDLDFIIPGAIGRIEVLEDGAAAQYGSDAIAGVVNIIMKDDASGGMLSATAGQYYKSDGESYSGTANIGTKLGENGFLNLTGMYRFKNFSSVGGIDRRVSTPDGALRPGLSAAQTALYSAIPGYPHVNKLFGDPRSRLIQGSYNAGYDLGGAELYSFGTLSYRSATSNQSFRVPDRIIASPVLGVAGTLTSPGAIIFAPQGFTPQDVMHETDFGVTGGIKGGTDFKWDLSATYGRDLEKIYQQHSANASLFIDTHSTPTDFYIGKYISDELTLNADFTKELEVGFATPINIAFGAEYRRNSYTIGQGDAASQYKEGPQALPGRNAVDAGTHSRSNVSGYLDIAMNPLDELKLDVAGRFEHYTDFGNAVAGKFTARYDFSDAFALRGTVSNGFRAPTLAEQYYSSTNVGPNSATVQLPANSAAAKLVGFENLKPERSFSVSGGVVLKPIDRLTITVDYYHLSIRNRILGSGNLFGRGGAVNDPAVLAAIAAQGTTIDSTVPQVSVSSFTNGADTMTNGVDVVANYVIPSEIGTFNLGISGNYNKNKVSKIDRPALFDRTAISMLETGSPKFKIISSVKWEKDRASLVARGTVFGEQLVYYSPNGGTFYENRMPTAFIADLEAGYELIDGLKLSVGANNLFNKKTPTIVNVPGSGPVFVTSPGYSVYNAPMTFSAYGINGGYYYARIDFKF